MVVDEAEDRTSYTELMIRSREETLRRMQRLADGIGDLAKRIESDWPPPSSSPAPPYTEPPSTPPPSERH